MQAFVVHIPQANAYRILSPNVVTQDFGDKYIFPVYPKFFPATFYYLLPTLSLILSPSGLLLI